MIAPPRFHAEIESSRPLRAPSGSIRIRGWCFVEEIATAPNVRLSTPAGVLAMTARHQRNDVALIFPAASAAAQSGFEIAGEIRPGFYLARLEAQTPDGSWHVFKTLTLVVETPAFTATIEAPAATGPLRERLRVQGWALHPTAPITHLSVRYGHQETECEHGLPRADVPSLHPQAPDAARAGFRSRLHLSAAYGKLRVKARLANGLTAVAETALTVDIPADENIGREIDLRSHRAGLSTDPRDRIPSSAVTEPANLLFILPGNFTANNALQVAALANELAAAGHHCVVTVPHDPETLRHHRSPAFRGVSFAKAESAQLFPDGRGPDVIHAWTTRENVRVLATRLKAKFRSRLFVQLEDNEQQILALTLGRPFAELAALPDADLERVVPADLSHPRRSRQFLESADGITVITDRLREFAPAGRPCITVWPAADARFFYPRPLPTQFRAAIDPAPGTTILFYHGNVHAANAAEMRELYSAVVNLNTGGDHVVLIRAGVDAVDFLGDLAARVRPHVIELGQILHHWHLPPLMAMADIFVQPGGADAFNDYRFPSKLPEFFSIGRPVVLPRTNLGEAMRDGIDACVLERADAAGICAAVRRLRRDPALAAKLAAGATAFAAHHFSWRRSAAALAKFYGIAAPS